MPAQRLRIVVAALLGATVLACAAPLASPAPLSSVSGQISVDNGTSIAITVAVNGTQVAQVPPGTRQSPISATLAGRPWTVEARSPSGHVLASFTAAPDAAISDQASIGDVEFLTCGQLVVWAGAPMLDAPRPSGTLKPCD